jgi:transcriptional regulator with XRE-family HTH domain
VGKTRLYIGEWRAVRGMTQARLSQLLRVTPMTVSRWERGATPLIRRLEQVAKALHVEVIDLFSLPRKRRR